MKKRRKLMKSKALLISLIIGAIYGVYLIVNFGGALGGASSDEELVGAGIATMLVTPHIILVILAVIFNALGYFKSSKGFALTGGILYSVAAVVFLMYAPFLIVSIVCSFVGYSKVKKINQAKA